MCISSECVLILIDLGPHTIQAVYRLISRNEGGSREEVPTLEREERGNACICAPKGSVRVLGALYPFPREIRHQPQPRMPESQHHAPEFEDAHLVELRVVAQVTASLLEVPLLQYWR